MTLALKRECIVFEGRQIPHVKKYAGVVALNYSVGEAGKRTSAAMNPAAGTAPLSVL
jgi:hypothetical protein